MQFRDMTQHDGYPPQWAEAVPQTAMNPYGLEPMMPIMKPEPGYQHAHGGLSGHMGKLVRAECLVGHTLVEHTGRLVEAGDGYIMLQTQDGQNVMICDPQTVKFVTIYK